jgi:hypothetical protein
MHPSNHVRASTVRSATFVCGSVASIILAACGTPRLEAASTERALRSSLTFHASFDQDADAAFASGDARIHWAPSMKQPRTGSQGLPTNGAVTVVADGGKWGGALRFHRKVPDMVFFKAARNVEYRTNDWSGTVSVWLKLHPEEDLEPGYCDPIQITPRDWNDASFFVDFSKDERPRHFRLGAFADLKAWNPQNLPWEKVAEADRPMVTVTWHPFDRTRWTHVAFTFSRFNTGRKDGVAELYLNGKSHGALRARDQRFTWDMDQTLVMLGLNYIGWFDDLALFNRALNETEIEALYRLPRGVAGLAR